MRLEPSMLVRDLAARASDPKTYRQTANPAAYGGSVEPTIPTRLGKRDNLHEHCQPAVPGDPVMTFREFQHARVSSSR